MMRAGCAPIVAGDDGVILASNGRLMFQKFDYRRLRPVGTPVAVGLAPSSDVSVGQPLASASRNGVLAYTSESLTNTRLDLLDRSGNRVETLRLPEGRYESVYFAPDGKRLLAERRASPTAVDLWLFDLERGQSRRFSQGSQTRIGGKPVWSPDGSRIAFNSNRSGRTYIYQRLVDEAGEEQLLYESPGQFNEVLAWSPDGKYLVFEQAGPETGWDLWLLPVDGKREPVPYLKTRFHEYAASISPDGRWLAYTTDATGKTEIHARSFPKPGAEHLASNIAGQPFWSENREILNVGMQGVWSIPVSTSPTFRAGKPDHLFRGHRGAFWLAPTPAADRFLQISPIEDDPPTLTVDLNFLARTGP